MMHLCHDGKTVTLRLFTELQADSVPAKRPKYAAFLDTETTGTGPADRVIEVFVRPFEFCAETGRVTHVFDPVHGLQDPGRPLSADIVQITGLTDADVRGKAIDWQAVVKALQGVDFVIAFNAAFDRRMVDAELGLYQGGADIARDLIWGCAMSQVDWSAVRRTALAQDVLCAWHGFFYPPHRAQCDVDAGVHLLQIAGKLPELYRRATTPGYNVQVVGFPRQYNDLLKERGYRWNGTVWSREVADKTLADAELGWMHAKAPRAVAVLVQPQERFRA